MWAGSLGRLAIHLGTRATDERRGDASVASRGRVLRRVKILGTRGDSSLNAASEIEISAEYEIEGKSVKVVDVAVLRHLRLLGGGGGGESTGPPRHINDRRRARE